ncbi:YbfB/YjiJ family MFS transporter [Actinomadura sp. DC4]|uniref:YbfB/YjiJ family MFS transporter n=1 Tax=Actinomadura sp. DC4 TaxID=3055069 RepID=UPI0025B0EEA7|nr:YbfB/YjiJ family MFS transporter [Actinomadura sp. DC4]MDN3353076.1 YbfB/YjiJ family MFS transporter [Actinomadura sp. DC4]
MTSPLTTAPPKTTSPYLVALGLAAGPVVALGFTRFAYALLLPSMRDQLGWNYAAAGGMNTANAAGYIIGAATAAWWARRFGARAAFAWGMVVSAVALLASGVTGEFAALGIFRFVGGISTAVTFVIGSALATRVPKDGPRSAVLVALYMAGVGMGVAASGVVIPAALTAWGVSGWHEGWVLLGVLALLATGPAVWASRRVPEQAAGLAAGPRPRLTFLAPTFGWYVLFGAGYVSYMTFIVALLHNQGMKTWSVAAFFIVLGAASAAGTLLVWGRVIGRLRGGLAYVLVSVVVLIGVLPVLLWHGMGAAISSAVIFGGAFMAGPTAVTVNARRVLPSYAWTSGIALLTVAFSVGQAIGPLLSGLLSDSAGGISHGLWLSVLLLALSAGAALAQREHPPAA